MRRTLALRLAAGCALAVVAVTAVANLRAAQEAEPPTDATVSESAPTASTPDPTANPPSEWVQELLPETPPPPPVLEPGAPEPTTNREIIPSPPPTPRVAKRRKPIDPFKDLPKDAAPLEIEAALSQTPDLYVLVDPAESVIEVRSRGISLDSMQIARSEVLYKSGVFITGPAPHFPAPSLWRVQKTPDDAVRELIAPAELKRWVPEDDRPDEPAGTGSSAKPRQETQPPTSYRIQLNDGWDLAILGELPSRGFLTRLVEAAKSGWSRLVGKTVEHPPTVALVLSADDSRRLHHVFREGLPVLLSPRHSD